MARRRRDYYSVLGVSRDASDVEIKRAFRELARKHHPDVSPDDNGEAFREINEAYAVLSDPEARARYAEHRIVVALLACHQPPPLSGD